MDNIIAVLDILAWPLTVFVIVWLLRKPLMSLLPSIQRIKFQGAEVEFFSKSLRQIMDDVSEGAEVRIDSDPSDKGLRAALNLPPNQTVLEAWNALELCAREKVQSLLPADESFVDPLSRPLEYLEFKGGLTPTIARAIHDLRSLRNQAAHFGEDLVVRENAVEYVGIVERVLKAIEGITELPSVKLTALTLLILEIIALVDSGQCNDVTIEEVYEWIVSENIIQSLAERAKGHVDLSVYGVDGAYPNFASFYHEQMKQIYDGYGGDHKRKWGVENLGLCLLLAWTNQLIQQGSGWYPDES